MRIFFDVEKVEACTHIAFNPSKHAICIVARCLYISGEVCDIDKKTIAIKGLDV